MQSTVKSADPKLIRTCDVLNATLNLDATNTRSKLQRHSSIRCCQDPTHQPLHWAQHRLPPHQSPPKRCHYKAHTTVSVPVTQTLASYRPPPHPSPPPGSWRGLYLDHHPFIQSFSLPAHRIRRAVSPGTVCPPREPAAERGPRCTASREREHVLYAAGKEGVKQKRATKMAKTKEKG